MREDYLLHLELVLKDKKLTINFKQKKQIDLFLYPFLLFMIEDNNMSGLCYNNKTDVKYPNENLIFFR